MVFVVVVGVSLWRMGFLFAVGLLRSAWFNNVAVRFGGFCFDYWC